MLEDVPPLIREEILDWPMDQDEEQAFKLPAIMESRPIVGRSESQAHLQESQANFDEETPAITEIITANE